MGLDEGGIPKSLDCGSEGYTASLTNWHELLALTAPDSKCGLVYVVGRFPCTAEALLARTQNRDQAGGKGTFGIQFCPDSNGEFSLGNPVARGLINHRWPHLQYEFICKEFFDDGYYEQCTFVNQGIVYQVTRVTPGGRRHEGSNVTQGREELRTCQFKIGGPIFFRCACTNSLPDSYKYLKTTKIESTDEDKMLKCKVDFHNGSCYAESDKCCSLHMEFFVNGEKRPIELEHGQTYSEADDSMEKKTVEIDLSSIHQVDLVAGKETVLVLALSLTSGSKAQLSPKIHRSAPTSEDVKTILGVENDISRGIYNRTGNMWFLNREVSDSLDRRELQSIARTSEYLLSVSCIYFKPFDMSDQHSLEILSPHWRLVREQYLRRMSSDSLNSREAKDLDGVPDPASFHIPEPYQDKDNDREEDTAGMKSLTWSRHGTWLESATFVENIFFVPYVKSENVL